MKQQPDKSANETQHCRINLHDVRGTTRVEPPCNSVDKDKGCDEDQCPDIIDFKDKRNDPGRTGKVTGNQYGKAKGHQQ